MLSEAPGRQWVVGSAWWVVRGAWCKRPVRALGWHTGGRGVVAQRGACEAAHEHGALGSGLTRLGDLRAHVGACHPERSAQRRRQVVLLGIGARDRLQQRLQQRAPQPAVVQGAGCCLRKLVSKPGIPCTLEHAVLQVGKERVEHLSPSRETAPFADRRGIRMQRGLGGTFERLQNPNHTVKSSWKTSRAYLFNNSFCNS